MAGLENTYLKYHINIFAAFKKVALALTVLLPLETSATEELSFRAALIGTLVSNKKAQAFYETTNFSRIWTDSSITSAARRIAFLKALEVADTHALPEDEYQLRDIVDHLKMAKSNYDLGILEGMMTKSFLRYAEDVHSGLLKPSDVDKAIAHKIKYIPDDIYLSGLMSSDPFEFVASLAPQTLEYSNLLKARQHLLAKLERGGWGALVPDGRLSLGDTGPAVIALRKRLIEQGYLQRSISGKFDSVLMHAVMTFQEEHGLLVDGIAGTATISELNVTIEDRLKAIAVALERERWHNSLTPFKTGSPSRKILVNLTDFTAKILDNDIVTFETRSVVGADEDNQRSPEFSDVMEHMVINPTWYVPRSISVNEYLPELQVDPTVHSYLTLFTPEDGSTVPREIVNFKLFDEENFPFEMKQLPSQSNALGLVKFMFPNQHNIYLHDTPHKLLFFKERRTFSHGCIRLQDPFEFAYALLASQSGNPINDFHSILETGKETTIVLKKPVPVHIIYRTAVSFPDGRVGFRPDIYGRDALIFAALVEAGVVIRQNQG